MSKTLLILLMLRTEQVIDRLDRIESSKGHLDHDSIPVAHGTIPQTRQFQCLQFLAVFTLVRDESCSWVNEIRQIEFLALIVTYSANQIHGVKVCTLCEHLHVLRIILVYLATLKNLQ